MHNISLNHLAGMFIKNPVDMLVAKDKNKKIRRTHDSVLVMTLVVKEHGESLLIKHPKAASTLAARGISVSPAITYLFPLPYRSLKKVMQALFFNMFLIPAA
jgi:hypothetical protein